MVAVGQANPNDGGYFSDLCEVINMIDSTSSCNNLPAYPLPITSSTGQVVNSVPIMAGGHQGLSWHISSVYKFDKQSMSWLSLGNLAKPRVLHSSTILNGALWIIGGYSYGENLKSTELVYPNGTITSGPDLPGPRWGHCSVQLEDGKILIVGGGSDSMLSIYNYKVTTMYDPENSRYTAGPDMLFGHDDFGCAHFYSQKHGGRPVVLSAGDGSYGGGSKAEVYDYTLENGTWEESKQLKI